MARRFMPAAFRQILTVDSYVSANRDPRASREYCVTKARRLNPAGFSWDFSGKFTMSLSSAKNYALRAERSQDAKDAADLLAKAILELAAAIEATDAKVKKMNKSG
ncbi:hypothetical protein SAMN05443247_07386 [Bradyrhizobium erythrophlei]|nr:hypothetical protein SAMN05443247_07386 [Bradyrhizobium erythrophlei]